MNKRILYIDGLRGLACIFVFINHFLMAFFPASYLGNDAVTHFDIGIEAWYSQAPVSALTNGNFWVCVFLVVSAFVISYGILKKSEGNSEEYHLSLAKSFIKRYPRLMLPVFAVCVIILLASWCGLFANNSAAAITGSSLMQGRYEFRLSLKELFSSALVKIWLFSDETFSNSFWMLTTLFLGGFLSSILSIMAGKKNRHILLLYGFFALLLASVGSLYLTFVFGTMLAYIVVRKESWLERIQSSTLGIICAVLLLLFGLFLGGYPSGVTPTNIYRFLNHLPDTVSAYEFYHMVGAVLITGAIFCLSGIQKFLSAKPIQFLGNISFAVYLLNLPLIFSLSSGLAIIFYNTQLIRNYGLLALLILIISAVSLLLLSYLFHRFVEPVCDKITSAILSYFIQ